MCVQVLYHARLHPEQLLSALGDEHVAALHAALKMVIDTAVAADADASKFGDDWMFHVRCVGGCWCCVESVWARRAGLRPALHTHSPHVEPAASANHLPDHRSRCNAGGARRLASWGATRLTTSPWARGRAAWSLHCKNSSVVGERALTRLGWVGWLGCRRCRGCC